MIMDRIALVLAIVGGINWGSVGLFRFDIVAWLCGGETAVVSRVIYTLVGLAALWCVSLLFRSREEEAARARSRKEKSPPGGGLFPFGREGEKYGKRSGVNQYNSAESMSSTSR